MEGVELWDMLYSTDLICCVLMF